MDDVIGWIKNPVFQTLAEQSQHQSKGDFGMTVVGGVNLDRYAELIIAQCNAICIKNHRQDIADDINASFGVNNE